MEHSNRKQYTHSRIIPNNRMILHLISFDMVPFFFTASMKVRRTGDILKRSCMQQTKLQTHTRAERKIHFVLYSIPLTLTLCPSLFWFIFEFGSQSLFNIKHCIYIISRNTLRTQTLRTTTKLIVHQKYGTD